MSILVRSNRGGALWPSICQSWQACLKQHDGEPLLITFFSSQSSRDSLSSSMPAPMPSKMQWIVHKRKADCDCGGLRNYEERNQVIDRCDGVCQRSSSSRRSTIDRTAISSSSSSYSPSYQSISSAILNSGSRTFPTPSLTATGLSTTSTTTRYHQPMMDSTHHPSAFSQILQKRKICNLPILSDCWLQRAWKVLQLLLAV